MEKMTLTTPVDSYEITFVALDWHNSQIVIGYKNELGQAHSLVIIGAPALTMMTDMNKADFTVKSIHKTCLEKLNADGVLIGAISGTPD